MEAPKRLLPERARSSTIVKFFDKTCDEISSAVEAAYSDIKNAVERFFGIHKAAVSALAGKRRADFSAGIRRADGPGRPQLLAGGHLRGPQPAAGLRAGHGDARADRSGDRQQRLQQGVQRHDQRVRSRPGHNPTVYYISNDQLCEVPTTQDLYTWGLTGIEMTTIDDQNMSVLTIGSPLKSKPA